MTWTRYKERLANDLMDDELSVSVNVYEVQQAIGRVLSGGAQREGSHNEVI